MDERLELLFKLRARIFKALGHPSRLLMVEEISRRERCVQELTELVGSDISTVSKHLSLLKEAGVIDDEKRGSRVFYHLKMQCVLEMFECIEPVLEERIRKQLVSLSPD